LQTAHVVTTHVRLQIAANSLLYNANRTLDLMPHEKPDIPGANAIVEMLGSWPSFHDAEIVRLRLERDGVSTVSIQLVGPDGRCKGGHL
jgi:hypothetical protein